MAANIRKNRLPRACPKCGGRMVKNGKTSYNAKQMWICKSCGNQTIRPVISRD